MVHKKITEHTWSCKGDGPSRGIIRIGSISVCILDVKLLVIRVGANIDIISANACLVQLAVLQGSAISRKDVSNPNSVAACHRRCHLDRALGHWLAQYMTYCDCECDALAERVGKANSGQLLWMRGKTAANARMPSYVELVPTSAMLSYRSSC